MNKLKRLIIPSTVLLLISCNQGQQNKVVLNRVNFDNAMFSFVAQRPNENPTLFTIDYYPDENVCLINEPTFTYVKQDSMEIVQKTPVAPLKIFEFTDRYIFFAYSNTPNEEVDKLNYLMDRKTGECFPFPTNSVPLFKYGNHDVSNNYYIGNFQIDKNDYVYYVANEYKDDRTTLYHPLNRIDLSNPGNIKITKVSHEFDSVYDAYAINQDGDVIYRYKDGDNVKTAYVHHDGTYYQNDALNVCKNLFPGFDNRVYMLAPNDGHIDIDYFDYSTKTLKNVATYQGTNCDFEEIFYFKDFVFDSDNRTDIVAGLYGDGFQTLYINNMSGELAPSKFSTKDPETEGLYSLIKEDRCPFFSFDREHVLLAGRDTMLKWAGFYAITPYPGRQFQNTSLQGSKLPIEKFFATASTHTEVEYFPKGLSIYFVDTSEENKSTFDICLQGQMFEEEFIKDNNWSVVNL